MVDGGRAVSASASTASILDGIRIVDLTTGISGPVATWLLAEAGADVVKVEPPAGDPMRRSPGFRTWNRSKRGVVLELGDPSGAKRLRELLASADVLVHGLRPSTALRHRLDEESLAADFPQLVVCSVLGFPVGHPDADRPGYDILVQARMGLMDEQRGNRDGPIFLRFPIPSWNAAFLGAAGVLARLRARGRDGRGGPVHTSLIQGALAPMMQYWAHAETPSPSFAYGLPKNMMSGLYECGDGVWIHNMGHGRTAEVPLVQQTLATLSPADIEAARSAIAHQAPTPNAVDDPARLVAAFLQRPAAEWLEALWAADIAVQEVAPPGQVLRDEQARACGYLVDVDDPEVGRVTQAGAPYELSPPARVRGPAPALGQHDDEVFAEWTAAGARADEARERPAAALGSPGPDEPPLAGIRVLDFGNYLAGPFAPMLLGDLGADVIKLEATTGDAMRPVARSFCGCQRGKRSLALDLKHPEARGIVERITQSVDIVHHNLRYPAARKLGIDYDSLRAYKPDLIYCHTSSYGPRGPRADWPGYDQLFQACSGWEVAGGGPGNPPIWHRMGTMDHANAFSSLFATLLALRHRERTGEGQFLTSSILGAAVVTASELYLGADGALPPFPEIDPGQHGIAPGYRIYRTEGAGGEGYVAVAALSQERLAALLSVAGVERAEQLEDALRAREQRELADALEAAGVPAEIVRTGQERGFFEREEHRAGGLVASYPHAEMGQMEQVGAFWNLGDLPLVIETAPPALGQHSHEILGEVGYTTGEVDAWIDAGVIVAADGGGANGRS
jgi:crotonobetainyl-CoA:carnitine CoA-transferase CaiB-like acyl-CoA transferase